MQRDRVPKLAMAEVTRSGDNLRKVNTISFLATTYPWTYFSFESRHEREKEVKWFSQTFWKKLQPLRSGMLASLPRAKAWATWKQILVRPNPKKTICDVLAQQMVYCLIKGWVQSAVWVIETFTHTYCYTCITCEISTLLPGVNPNSITAFKIVKLNLQIDRLNNENSELIIID